MRRTHTQRDRRTPSDNTLSAHQATTKVTNKFTSTRYSKAVKTVKSLAVSVGFGPPLQSIVFLFH